MLKPLELISHEALEGWAKKSPMDWNLRDSSDEEVDVVRVGVDQLQPLHDLLGDEVGKVVEAVGLLQAAHLTPRIVARQSVVPTSLDVQGDQVHPEAVVLGLEQVVGQLFAEDVVELLPGLGGQPDQEAVKGSRAVHQLWVEEGGREWDAVRLLAVVVDLFHQAADIAKCYFLVTLALSQQDMYLLQKSLHKRVSESEGSRGEAVDDGGVDLGVVLVVVTVGHGQNVQLRHVLRPKHNRQPLVVCDVLVEWI